MQLRDRTLIVSPKALHQFLVDRLALTEYNWPEAAELPLGQAKPFYVEHEAHNVQISNAETS